MIPIFYEGMTIGEKYKPAMEVTDPDEAKEYFEQAVQHTMKMGKTLEKAIQIEKANFGYFAGYYDAETRERVERLFNCAHPIFGAIAVKGQPTTEEALEAGMNFAKNNN